LHFYLEPADEYIASEEGMAAVIREQFRKLDRKYRCNFYGLIGDMETGLDLKPLQVTLLPRGAFSGYMDQWRTEGAGLGRVNHSHINPPDEVLSLLGVPKVVVEAVAVTEAERAVAR
jgi:hypothetical protein